MLAGFPAMAACMGRLVESFTRRRISATSASVNSSGQAIYGANNAPTTVYGISPDYMEIRRYEVEDGDMFSDQDVQTAAKVCVIGKTVVDNLFPGGENPVGRVIRFQKLPFREIGRASCRERVFRAV